MKFVCERCHTKYSIADEKVRGKVLKVRCKNCEDVITVRESGASIDDRGISGPKEAPIVRSGTLDAATSHPAAAAKSGPVAARSGAATRKSVPSMPVAAFLAPGAPGVAPPARRSVPTPRPLAPLVEDDGIEWYLAVDGAQTGPFRRPVLIEKILAVRAGGDIHVWNVDLGVWRPPKDVPAVQGDLLRRRRPPMAAPPAPPRRPSGSMAALAPEPRAIPTEISDGHSGSNGVSAFSEAADTQISGGPPVPWKRNGLGAPATTEPAGKTLTPAGRAQTDDGVGFELEDLLRGDVRDTATPPLLAVTAPAASLPALSSGAAISPTAAGSRVRPVKLIAGLIALVAIVCGIVAVAILRRPSLPVAAAPQPSPKPAGTDFANLADKLANEQVAVKTAPPPETSPPPAEEAKAAIAKVESPGKSGRAKGHNNHKPGGGGQLATGPTSPPPMTAEQIQAASRFGESSAREVRAAPAASASTRSTPAQADISRVITNNRQGIQTCYQRALLRDSTLTQGRVNIRVSIGLSGKVKSVTLDAPPQFRSMESCVKDVMSRWAFPPSSEEYGTEFPVVLQGNQ